ncbi:hypothetical protein [Cohnella abietis]|uniref:Lipoprotein n=1 Tax=Cohnella abietis TaxID=2507935 RepID=A0A3T1DDT1_9BACL|nr:hypothetical protein [Cohnella abietis]BBI36249.1 hypothetical protein KCTCHS21_56480 [Cohnella abietis]
MRRMYPLLAAALLALILAGCSANSNNGGTTDVPNNTQKTPISSPQGLDPTVTSGSGASASPTETSPPGTNDSQVELKNTAREVIEALRERDLNSLNLWIDPEQGLRFSPYSPISTDSDLVFKADQLPTFKDQTKLKWGTADGTGDPIELSFRDYYEKFVYNQDFIDAPSVSVNKVVGTGNSINNITTVYPNASYVEYHFPGFDKKVEGMDWQSLILVFVPHEDEWKLVAIVHNQWTI